MILSMASRSLNVNTAGSVVLVGLLFVSGAVVNAQVEYTLSLPPPPPIKFVSNEETALLNAQSDLKRHVRLQVELVDTHLRNAEQLTTAQDFIGAAIELGAYQGLLDNVVNYLAALDQNSNKTRDLCKMVEIAFRANVPRLEGMRRSTPEEYSASIRELIDFTRDARVQALNAFYKDGAVSDPVAPPLKLSKEKVVNALAPPGKKQ